MESRAPLPDPSIYANTITSEELRDMLMVYASDEFKGRDAGTPSEELATDYLKNYYKAEGISSPKSTSVSDYLQKVPIKELRFPDATISVDGQSFKLIEDLTVSQGNASETFSASEIVYVGYGIKAENYSDYKNLNVKGKVVLAKAGEPKDANGNYITTGTSEGTKWTNGRQARRTKEEAAKEMGAKAFILFEPESFETLASFYKRFQNSDRRSLGLVDENDKFLSFVIGDNLAKALYNEIGESADPKVLSKSIKIDLKRENAELKSHNVVAYIPGSELPNEYLIISAHLDHVGVQDGEVYNGADDDGSGTISVLEIAEAFQKAVENGHRPKRSVVFLHVTAEEKGLLGSRYYADSDPVFPLDQTIANLNIDMIGRVDPKHENDRNYLYIIGSDRLSSDLHQISEEVNNKYTKINFDYTYNDPKDPNRFYNRSDHYNFAKHNIPIIFYFNGTHADYHRPGDTPDKIEYDLMENRARLVFYTAWELANGVSRPVVDKAEVTKP
ncbi:M28 family peptidase [Aegicerativicinus sediminis]